MKALRAGLITDTYFDVHYVHHVNGNEMNTSMELSIQHEVKKLSRCDDVYERLANSLAPEIYGHSDIKKALFHEMRHYFIDYKWVILVLLNLNFLSISQLYHQEVFILQYYSSSSCYSIG